jgi:hypothetical protein
MTYNTKTQMNRCRGWLELFSRMSLLNHTDDVPCHNLHLAFFYNHTSFLVKVYCFNFAYSRAFQASMSCIVVAVC